MALQSQARQFQGASEFRRQMLQSARVPTTGDKWSPVGNEGVVPDAVMANCETPDNWAMPMIRSCLFVAWSCSVAWVLAADAPAPLSPAEAVKAAKVPPGFQVTLSAAEPDIVQPISFCIDDRGRLWVAEALNYGAWRETGKDRITILEDKDGDGRFETRKVFCEGFNYITGLEVGFGGVWVMSTPNLYFVPDKNGDDVPDGPPQVLFDGFGYKESRHNLANGFTWGPDGWLYAGHGRTSPSDVGPPGTPADKRIHCDGGIYRIHPVKKTFEVFADGTTNPWGVDYDEYGQFFVSNCVTPHLYHMIQGGHFEPWRNRPSSQYAYERLPTIADHFHYPANRGNPLAASKLPEADALGGGHAHCGTLVYKADNFPAEYRGTVFMCNVHGRRINNDILKPRGSGYVASHGPDFYRAGDPWFMGVTLRLGPNGGIFVSDWSDTGECHTLKPHTDNGRIYCITYGPYRPAPVDLQKKTNEELAALQTHANEWYAIHARRILQERFAAGVDMTDVAASTLCMMLAKGSSDVHRLRALWTMHVTGQIVRDPLGMFTDPAEQLRAWAVRLLCDDQRPDDYLLTRLTALAKSEKSPVVQLSLASALQRLPVNERLAVAQELLRHENVRTDTNLPLVIWYGLEPTVNAEPAKALEVAELSTSPLVRQFIARRFAEQAVAAKSAAAWSPLIQQLQRTEPADKLADLLQGVRAGVRGAKTLPKPEGWEEVYAQLQQLADKSAVENADALALLFGDAKILAKLRRQALNEKLPIAERKAALATLIDKRQSDLAPVLQSVLNERALRRLAIQGLAAYADPRTPALLLAKYAELSPDEKQDVVATLSARKEFAAELLTALEAKTIPTADLSAFLARQIYAFGDAKLSARLQQVWGVIRDKKPEKEADLAKYKNLLTSATLKAANLKNGRVLFQKTCQNCHLLFGEGGRIGPDLTGANRTNLDYLLGNILDPSAEIGQDYRMSVVATDNGQIITGIILEQTPARLTIQTEKEKVIVAATDVEAIKTSDISMMPEGQLDKLMPEEVRDLIAYLGSPVQVPQGK